MLQETMICLIMVYCI